jgi:hypothetical protein
MVLDEATKARLIHMAKVVREEAEAEARANADDFSGGRN